ncbi:MAG: VWA domain-containing protein [Pseudomonadota bacterium]
MTTAAPAFAEDNVMVVFDGSNSMWGQIDGLSKIEIARDVMDNLLGDWVDERRVGLMAYGHRRRGDCGDIEVLVTPGAAERGAILDRIAGITPTGKTPLTDAVQQAAEALSYEDSPATVVLISDGVESCERDPCALARALEQGGVGFTAHVVGFGLGREEDTRSLACIAEATGGQYITAANADELGDALSAVGSAVAQAVPVAAPLPAPTQVPEPEPVPDLETVLVDGPDTAIGGSDIVVTWDPTVAEGDYINIVPVGAEDNDFGTYERIGRSSEVEIAVTGTPGAYEIRYLHSDTYEVLGRRALTIIEPEVALSVTAPVTAGARFDVSWTPTINRRDYVAIVPVGAEAGSFGNYQSVRTRGEVTLTAPADPGLYEVRYILNVDRSTAGSTTVEVMAPSVTVQAPDAVATGGLFDVSWSGAVDPLDYITIVPAGAEAGAFGNFIKVRDDGRGRVRAPEDAGQYEVRYILNEGNRTLASVPIEVVAPDVTISGPASVLTGETFDVAWSASVHPRDVMAIVPMGAADGTFGNYVTVRDNATGQLTAPSEPGLYELRYILDEGSKTLARAAIEVTVPEVTISAPGSVLAGSTFDVSWSAAISPRDYINIVPMGADEGSFGNYAVVRGDRTKALQAPAEPGLYELRYLLREGNTTLARIPIEVTAAEVTLSAPQTVVAGSAFDVSWSAAISPRDYINIVPVGADEGVFGNYAVVRDDTTKAIQAPSDPGMYEVRYLLREGNKTIARVMVEITEPQVTISAASEIRAGEDLAVSWDGTVHTGDYVTLSPMGTPDDTLGVYRQVRTNTALDLTAPDETGVYEVRYVLREGGRVLARQRVEVVARDAQLDAGASIKAPDTAAPGATIEVSWDVDSDSTDQRITLARGDQAIFTWIAAEKITGAPPMALAMPQTPGVYEIRFLDLANQAVLSRKVITVE